MTLKTIKFFSIFAVLICFIYACNNKTETQIVEHATTAIDTLNIGCPVSYELNILGNLDTINKVYGKENIKHGHWITFGMIIPKEKRALNSKENSDKNIIRAKLEEGFYRNNKKEGFWKFYNNDGSFKDSIEYKNDVVVTK